MPVVPRPDAMNCCYVMLGATGDRSALRRGRRDACGSYTIPIMGVNLPSGRQLVNGQSATHCGSIGIPRPGRSVSNHRSRNPSHRG